MPGRRILVVEDNSDLRELLQLYLSNAGFEVALAEDGLAGLAAVRERPPDVLVLDLVIPGLDGSRLIATLRDDPTLAPIPVVLYSGIPETDARVVAAKQLDQVVYQAKGPLRHLVNSIEMLLAASERAEPVA